MEGIRAMHIVYVTSEFVTEKEYGGLAVYLNNISNIMSRHGHKVTIVTLSECEGELLYKKDIDVIRVKRTPLEPLKDDLYAAISMLENSWLVLIQKLMETVGPPAHKFPARRQFTPCCYGMPPDQSPITSKCILQL